MIAWAVVLALQQIDPAIPEYHAETAIEGELPSVGSDTLNNLMTLWGEQLAKRHPLMKPTVEGKGSGTAVPALIAYRAPLGPMSRELKDTELKAFREARGYEPTSIRVACDALAVFVNAKNPLQEITLEQVDAIWSKSRRRGHPHAIVRWDQLGLDGEWADKPVSAYGRNSASGTYGFFKERALLNGDFSDECKEQPGMSIILPVAVDRFGVGYTGVGYATSAVRALRISPKAGEPAVAPTMENSLDGRYPLSRFLKIAVDKPPGRPLPTAVREYLRFVLSREGQEVVVKDGYFPLPEKIAAEERKKLE